MVVRLFVCLLVGVASPDETRNKRIRFFCVIFDTMCARTHTHTFTLHIDPLSFNCLAAVIVFGFFVLLVAVVLLGVVVVVVTAIVDATADATVVDAAFDASVAIAVSPASLSLLMPHKTPSGHIHTHTHTHTRRTQTHTITHTQSHVTWVEMIGSC